MTRNPIPRWVAGLLIIGVAVLPMLPFWLAIGLVTACCVWAAYEVATFRRRAARIAAAHALFQREVARLPRREEPKPRDVLRVASEFPPSWRPFIRPVPPLAEWSSRRRYSTPFFHVLPTRGGARHAGR